MTSHYIVLLKCSIRGLTRRESSSKLSTMSASKASSSELTLKIARITVDGSHGIASKNHSGCNFVAVAASSIDWVGGMKKNTGPAFSSNLVRKSGLFLSPSLVLCNAVSTSHLRTTWRTK